jgi:hypothetical protein
MYRRMKTKGLTAAYSESLEDHAWRHQQSVRLFCCVYPVMLTKQIDLIDYIVVDFDPWQGNFSDLLVENNRIYGGFAETVSLGF